MKGNYDECQDCTCFRCCNQKCNPCVNCSGISDGDLNMKSNALFDNCSIKEEED